MHLELSFGLPSLSSCGPRGVRDKSLCCPDPKASDLLTLAESLTCLPHPTDSVSKCEHVPMMTGWHPSHPNLGARAQLQECPEAVVSSCCLPGLSTALFLLPK